MISSWRKKAPRSSKLTTFYIRHSFPTYLSKELRCSKKTGVSLSLKGLQQWKMWARISSQIFECRKYKNSFWSIPGRLRMAATHLIEQDNNWVRLMLFESIARVLSAATNDETKSGPIWTCHVLDQYDFGHFWKFSTFMAQNDPKLIICSYLRRQAMKIQIISF